MILGVSLLFSLFASASAVRTYHSTHGEATGSLRDAPVDGLCDENVKQLSGYYDVKSGVDKHYFFWFFESRSKPSTDPLVIWLTGGPGCSSQLALMTENGPCTASADGKTTVNNPYSWNSNANIMWIDQPANVGYSYSTSKKDEDHNEGDVSEDMYNFLQEFFKAHGEYLPNEFYVFGESYGGHYVPAISSRIYEGNQKKEGVHINLQGLGIGNGLTNPVVQYQYYPEMAMNNSYGIKTVSEEDYAKMVEKVPRCKKMAEACQADQDLCVPADDYCNLAETQPYYKTGLNPYNIKVPCGDSSLCYDFTNVETFLNLESTRQALHVSDDVKSWTECNNKVNAAFAGDWMRKFSENLVPMLEDGIRALVYAGDLDFICNWIGNKAWTKDLDWSGKSAYSAAKDQDWKFALDGASAKKGGMVRTASAAKGSGSLTFLQVYEGGHMVPMDQPEAALSLLNTFTANKPFA